MSFFSRSAPTRGGDNLVSYLPDDLFEESPSIERVMMNAPNTEITFADLEVVRECAGSPGPLKRFVPEASSQAEILIQTPMAQIHPGGFAGALKRGLGDSPSYTLSPQSSLKPPSFGSDKLGTSFGADKVSPPMTEASPPVAVYSYATSAGTSAHRLSSGFGSGKPPRAGFKPGSLQHSKSSFGDRAARTSMNGTQPTSTVKFTGAAFRSARDEYLEKVLTFLTNEHGEEWVPIKSKSGVSGRCRKPVTMPETYLEFFDTHRDKFEICSEKKKVRLRERVLSDSGESDGTAVDSLSDGLKRL